MRYALYFAPPLHDPLHQAASLWLGRDAITGLSHPIAGNPAFSGAEMTALTAEPRRYGFHATLKAPFELADGHAEIDLLEAFHRFADRHVAFNVSSLVVGRLDAFFALVADGPQPELQEFADRVVSAFEPFRAPLGETDILRRDPDTLTESQRSHLCAFGYPYVFSDFRFHMTLTGAVREEDRPAVHRLVEAHFEPFVGRPLRIGHLSLFAEPERGRPFHLIAQASLGAAKNRRFAP